ncbi:ISNCY family transposase ISRel26 [Paenochrobactrum sp. BZR 201-1]
MGWILMSERELHRIEGRMTLASAAHVLALSERHVHRLLDCFINDGAASIRHRSRGCRLNNHLPDGIRDYALTLIRERYLDFGPILAAEKLAEHHGLSVSRETLRKWM